MNCFRKKKVAKPSAAGPILRPMFYTLKFLFAKGKKFTHKAGSARSGFFADFPSAEKKKLDFYYRVFLFMHGNCPVVNFSFLEIGPQISQIFG